MVELETLEHGQLTFLGWHGALELGKGGWFRGRTGGPFEPDIRKAMAVDVSGLWSGRCYG